MNIFKTLSITLSDGLDTIAKTCQLGSNYLDRELAQQKQSAEMDEYEFRIELKERELKLDAKLAALRARDNFSEDKLLSNNNNLSDLKYKSTILTEASLKEKVEALLKDVSQPKSEYLKGVEIPTFLIKDS